MAKPSPQSDLAAAAEALEEELHRYEELCRASQKEPLTSQRALERVAKSLKEVADSDERLGERVKALVQAVTRVRERQQSLAESVQTRALDLQRRTEVFQELLRQYEKVGEQAILLNGRVQEIAKDRQEGGMPAGDLAELVERAGQVAELAGMMEAAASEHDFMDLARQADSLRQQLLSAKNKMSLLHKSAGPSA